MIQLREKDLPALDLYRYSVKLRSLTHKYDSLLVINDRIDIARAIGADGVHLGRASLPVDVARRQLGDGALVGVSTHSLEEARAAEQDGASFITYGPVFYTPSKARYGNPVGIQSLEEICRTISLPVYALGGISTQNISQIKTTGIHGIAAISALLTTPFPNQTLNQLGDSLNY